MIHCNMAQLRLLILLVTFSEQATGFFQPYYMSPSFFEITNIKNSIIHERRKTDKHAKPKRFDDNADGILYVNDQVSLQFLYYYCIYEFISTTKVDNSCLYSVLIVLHVLTSHPIHSNVPKKAIVHIISFINSHRMIHQLLIFKMPELH